MKKIDIIKRVHITSGVEEKELHILFDEFLQAIKDSLAMGEPVYLRGFGTFTIKHRKAKIARNITARQSMVIPEHDIPFFKPSKGMKI